jgi:hypothetical protein
MPTPVAELGPSEVRELLAGDLRVSVRLATGVVIRFATPLRYPGRRGNITVVLTPEDAPAGGERPVRMSDGGGLVKCLDEQGLDLETDLVLSKTVFHAIKQVEGAGLGGGEVYLDSTAGNVPEDLWRFLQLLVEILGLRHAKYKDALLQLSRRQDQSVPRLVGWD